MRSLRLLVPVRVGDVDGPEEFGDCAPRRLSVRRLWNGEEVTRADCISLAVHLDNGRTLDHILSNTLLNTVRERGLVVPVDFPDAHTERCAFRLPEGVPEPAFAPHAVERLHLMGTHACGWPASSCGRLNCLEREEAVPYLLT